MPKYTNIRPIAGMNTFECPICESTVFVPLNLETYYRILAAAGGKSEAECPSGHKFDVSWAAGMGK